MPGPCSQPAGDKARWEELNEKVCEIHFHCNMEEGREHNLITFRMWLVNRGQLTTGKTV